MYSQKIQFINVATEAQRSYLLCQRSYSVAEPHFNTVYLSSILKSFIFYCTHAQNKHVKQRKKSLSMMQMEGFVEKVGLLLGCFELWILFQQEVSEHARHQSTEFDQNVRFFNEVFMKLYLKLIWENLKNQAEETVSILFCRQ